MFIENPHAAQFALITLFFAVLTGLFFYHMIKFKQDEKAAAKQAADEAAKSAREMRQAFCFDKLYTGGDNKPKGSYKDFIDTQMMEMVN